MAFHLTITLAIVAFAFSFAYAYDPSPLQDFCVASNDPKATGNSTTHRLLFAFVLVELDLLCEIILK